MKGGGFGRLFIVRNLEEYSVLNKYLTKVAAYFDLASISGNGELGAEKSDVEIKRDLKKTLAERKARNESHMASVAGAQRHLKEQQASKAKSATIKADPAYVIGNHIDDSVIGSANLHEVYGAKERASKISKLRPQQGSGHAASETIGKMTSMLSRNKGKLALLGGATVAAGAYAAHEKAAGENEVVMTSGAVAGAGLGIAAATRLVQHNALKQFETGANARLRGKEMLQKLRQIEASKLPKAGVALGLGGALLGSAIAAKVPHEKTASNAFTRNIGKAFSSAVSRGESGAHMMALREAKNLPASSAKSEALQKAMRSGGGDSARHVTGNPKVNREIAEVKDIGNTSRAIDSFKTKAGFKSLEGDRHLGILERVNAVKNLG